MVILQMTTFAHPTARGARVIWGPELSDDDKDAITAEFRLVYEERRFKPGKDFDADAEEAKIPAVVRAWEAERIKRRDAEPPQTFLHPLYRIDVDWRILARASRMIVVDLFRSNPDLEWPDFVRSWAKNHGDGEVKRLKKELDDAVSHHEERTVDQTRAVLQDAVARVLKEVDALHTTFNLILDQDHTHGDPMFLRLALYKLLMSCNETWSVAKSSNTQIVRKLATVDASLADRQMAWKDEIAKRHQDELRAAEETFTTARKERERIFTEKTQPLITLYGEAAQKRFRFAEVLFNARDTCAASNIGVNISMGTLMAVAAMSNGGSVHLDEKRVKYLRKEIWPLLHSAARKYPNGVTSGAGEPVGHVQKFLERWDQQSTVEYVDVYQLNGLFHHYSIQMPKEYIKDIQWLGDPSANFQEFFDHKRRERAQGLQQQMDQQQMDQRQRLLAEKLNQTPPTTTGEGATTSPSPTSSPESTESSSAASAETSPSLEGGMTPKGGEVEETKEEA